MRNLIGLCRGDFDGFCDDIDVLHQRNVDTCPVSVDESKGDADTDYARQKKRKYGKPRRGSAYQGILDIDNNDGGLENNNEYLSNMDKRWTIAINAGVVVMMIIVNIMGCFYFDCKWKKQLKQDRVKYHDVDQDKV